MMRLGLETVKLLVRIRRCLKDRHDPPSGEGQAYSKPLNLAPLSNLRVSFNRELLVIHWQCKLIAAKIGDY